MNLLITRLRRSLWRTKLRNLTVLALIIVATTSAVGFSSMANNLNAVYDDFYQETNLGDVFVDTRGFLQNESTLLSACEDLIEFARDSQTPVVACETRLSLAGSFAADEQSDWIQATFHGIDSGGINGLYMTEGEQADAIDEVVLDTHVRDELGVAIGDEVRLLVSGSEIELEVVGFANNPEHLWYAADDGNLFPSKGGYAVIYLPVDSLTQHAGLSLDSRNRLLVDLKGDPRYDLSDTVENEGVLLEGPMQNLSGGLRSAEVDVFEVYHRGGILSVDFLRQDLEGNEKFMPFMAGVLAIIAGFVISISLDRLVKQQRYEIANLRTLGFTSSEIRNHYLLMPLSLGVIGGGLGVITGAYASIGLMKYYVSFIGIPLVQIRHEPLIFLIAFISVLTITMIFGMRPAFKAAQMMPLEVLRNHSDVKPNHTLNRMLKPLPTWVGLGIRASIRKPGRLAVTVVALGLAMTILGGSIIMTEATAVALDENLLGPETWETQALFPSYMQDEVWQWVDSHDVEFEWLLMLNGNGAGDQRSFIVYGLDAISEDGVSSMHRSKLSAGVLPQAGMIIPEVLTDEGTAKILGWKVGETIDVEIAGNAVQVKLVGTSTEMIRTMVMYRLDLASLTVDEVNGIRLRGSEAAPDEALRQVSFVSEKSVMQESVDELWKQQQAAMGTMLIVGYAIAISVLLNTLLINLAERDVELSTLRVLGASRWSLAGILTIENAIIGLVGGLVGTLFSVLMGYAMASLFQTWNFYMKLEPQISTLVGLTFAVFAAAIIVTPFAVRRIAKMDLVESIKQNAY